MLTDVCEGLLAPAASRVPEIIALATFPYDSERATGQIEARFRRELMGFHIAFFSLLAFALIHVIFSLWRPVKEFVRQSRAQESCSGGEAPMRESKDGSVDQQGARGPCPVAADHVRESQGGDVEMARRGERVVLLRLGNGAGCGVGGASAARHISLP